MAVELHVARLLGSAGGDQAALVVAKDATGHVVAAAARVRGSGRWVVILSGATSYAIVADLRAAEDLLHAAFSSEHLDRSEGGPE